MSTEMASARNFMHKNYPSGTRAASTVRRAARDATATVVHPTSERLLSPQRSAGNQAVLSMLSRPASEARKAIVGDVTRYLGLGRPLEAGVRRLLEAATGVKPMHVQVQTSASLVQRCGDHGCPPSGCEGHEADQTKAEDTLFRSASGVPSRSMHSAGAAALTQGHDIAVPRAEFRPDGRRRADIPATSIGHPLDMDLRTLFESRFTWDFSQVRVHTDTAADGLAGRLGALAFTVNDDIFFRQGLFAPHTESGRGLLAHELAHVAQQRGRHTSSVAAEVSQPADQAELEADEAGKQAAAGRTATVVTGRTAKVYRQTPQSPSSPPAAPAAIPKVFLDNNVFLEIARGNERVAQNLRAMAADPKVRVVTGKGVLNELTRMAPGVTPNEIAAYRAMIDKLHIEVLDVGIGKRIGTYETYAQYEQSALSTTDPKAFESQGLEGLLRRPGAKQERETLKDLPHIAEAQTAGAEIWTPDIRAQRTTRALGGSVAPGSGIEIPKSVRETSVENILRLIPEISADDLPKYGGTVSHPAGGSAGPAGVIGPGGPASALEAAPVPGVAPKQGGGESRASLTPAKSGGEPMGIAQLVAERRLLPGGSPALPSLEPPIPAPHVPSVKPPVMAPEPSAEAPQALGRVPTVPVVNPDALHPVLDVLRDIFRVLISPGVIVSVSVLLETINAVQMYAMAMGGLSREGFLFGKHIANLRKMRHDLEMALDDYRRLSDEVAQAANIAMVNALAGNRMPMDELAAFAQAQLPYVSTYLDEARDADRTLAELKTVATTQRITGEKLNQSREAILLMNILSTGPSATIVGAGQDMIQINSTAQEVRNGLTDLISVLEGVKASLQLYARVTHTEHGIPPKGH